MSVIDKKLEERIQVEERRKECEGIIKECNQILYKLRTEIDEEIRKHVLTKTIKGKWILQRGKGFYNHSLVREEQDEELVDIMNRVKNVGTLTSIRFDWEDEQYYINFDNKHPQIFGGICSANDVAIVRRMGIDVDISVLTKIKTQHLKAADNLQEEIDIWTLENIEKMK